MFQWPMIKRAGLVIAWIAFVLLSSMAAGAGPADVENTKSLNERLTTEAFKALEDRDWDTAVRKAAECIKEFKQDADELQKALAAKNEPAPPVGKVADEERLKILNRGPLNDVAACYYIQGEALRRLSAAAVAQEKEKLLAQAKAAYEAAARYTYARTWDPGGWFWDPARKSNQRLAEMTPIRKP